jgi:cyclic pyranopterin phosphate synthase
MKKFSHIDDGGEAKMVDVSNKPPMRREAIARGEIQMAPATLSAIEKDRIMKGNVFATARIAGIMAAKQTAGLIPLCHPISLTHCSVDFTVPAAHDRVVITACARTMAETGVEMEALTAVTMAALTIYDMCKAVDSTMQVMNVRLVSKLKTE